MLPNNSSVQYNSSSIVVLTVVEQAEVQYHSSLAYIYSTVFLILACTTSGISEEIGTTLVVVLSTAKNTEV